MWANKPIHHIRITKFSIIKKLCFTSAQCYHSVRTIRLKFNENVTSATTSSASFFKKRTRLFIRVWSNRIFFMFFSLFNRQKSYLEVFTKWVELIFLCFFDLFQCLDHGRCSWRRAWFFANSSSQRWLHSNSWKFETVHPFEIDQCWICSVPLSNIFSSTRTNPMHISKESLRKSFWKILWKSLRWFETFGSSTIIVDF